MRRLLLAVSLSLAMLPAAISQASAGPMSTSEVLRPQGSVTLNWTKCYRVCHVWGVCYRGYTKYRCCKHWKRVCH